MSVEDTLPGKSGKNMEDTQPTPRPDELETGPLLGQTGEPTELGSRIASGHTPTAGLPRPVPPPLRKGYVASGGSPPPASNRPRPPANNPKPRRDWLPRVLFISSLLVVVLFFLGIAAVVTGYVVIAAQLPPPDELINRQTEFVSSKIFDSDGELLYEVLDPQGGRRTYVDLSRMSPYVMQATIATEDADFYRHPGFNPIAILKAVYRYVDDGGQLAGASTITQQLARKLMLSPEERFERSLWRKIREAILAVEITRRYPRDTILEIYLNEINYGNLAYGIQAAAETYFRVDAADLTLAQASFLAGLPQSPALYDVFSGGRDRALARHQDVLRLMAEQGYINQAQAAAAALEIVEYEFRPPVATDFIPAAHFVTYVRQVVEATYGADALYRGDGYRIYTTLDRDLQELGERIVAERVAALADRDATNGALVAVDPNTGYILAMVGSADFYNEDIDGQVNVALRERQPGSSIKPLTYLAAFEQGWNPATIIWDLETEFPDGANPPYVPRNYDERFHGPVSVRTALANSYNIPAVKALQFIGLDAFREIAARLGITTLTRDDYGLSLTLGGGEVRLLEMVGAYAVFANEGVRVPPTPILRIESNTGEVLVDHSVPEGEQVVSPEHAYLITSILSDRQARCPAFGCPNNLELSRPAAAKTGSTNDYRDAWTIGYTPDLVTGVWVGNADNTEMINLPGSLGAGPIWHDFMEAALLNTPVQNFFRPAGIVEMQVCADSGARPTEYCPRRATEIFASDQPPPETEFDWYQMVRIDTFTGLLANEFCSDSVSEQLMLLITDEQGRDWAQANLPLPLAPLDYCTAGTGRPEVWITFPNSDAEVNGVVPIQGTVSLPNFSHYEVQYGVGGNPQGWGWISGPHLAQVRDGWLAEWDTTHLSPGLYTLRVTAWDTEGHRVEGRAQCVVAAPTALPTETPTTIPSATPTPLLTPTNTPLAPTATPTELVPTWTSTFAPTLTPTFVPTSIPTTAPTDTPVPPAPTATPTIPPPPPTSTPTVGPIATPVPTP